MEGEVSYVKAERESTRLMEVRLVDVLVASTFVIGAVLWGGRAGTGLGDSCLAEVGWGGVKPSRSRSFDLGLVRTLPIPPC